MGKNANYCYLNGAYYKTTDRDCVYAPRDINYAENGISSVIMDSINNAVINLYNYYTDLTTVDNKERVENMKNFLIDKKIKEIRKANHDYRIAVSYQLFNKDGKMIKDGEISMRAEYETYQMSSNVNEEDELKYHKGGVYSTTIHIEIPEFSKYGIKDSSIQYPYTLKINKLKLCTTVGERDFGIDEDTQVEHFGRFGHTTQAHFFHHENPRHDVHRYQHHFVTNAKVGTTIIDQTVRPAVLVVNPEYEILPMCEIDCDPNKYTLFLPHKLNSISMNIDIVLDNHNIVYDEDVIKDIILSNIKEEDNPVEDEPVEDNPSDDTPIEDKPTEDTPNDDNPIENDHVEDAPDNDIPNEDISTGDNPSEDNPSGDSTEPDTNKPDKDTTES